jgi:hypothetical protein
LKSGARCPLLMAASAKLDDKTKNANSANRLIC